MISEEPLEPLSEGGSHVLLAASVEDVDALYADLTAKGVKLLQAPADQPWGYAPPTLPIQRGITGRSISPSHRRPREDKPRDKPRDKPSCSACMHASVVNGLFSSAGQRSSCHYWIASSSRCAARASGCVTHLCGGSAEHGRARDGLSARSQVLHALCSLSARGLA